MRIVVPAGTDASSFVAAATFEEGSDFHLTLSDWDDGTISINVTRFSLRIVGPDDITGDFLNSYEPSAAEARFEERFVAWGRHAAPDPQEISDAQEVQLAEGWSQLLRLWHVSTVLPDLEGSQGVDILLAIALRQANSWITLANRLAVASIEEGIAVDFDAEIAALWDPMAEALREAMQRSFTRCIGAGGPDEAARLLIWSSVANHFGLWGFGGLDSAEHAEMINRCLRFRLDITSTFEGDTGEGEYLTAVNADIVLSAEDDLITTDTLYHQGYFLSEFPAECQPDAEDGRIRVDLIITANLNYRQARLENIRMLIEFLERPEEILSCAGFEQKLDLWYGHFIAARTLIGRRPQVTFQIVREPDLFARSRYVGPVNGVPGASEMSEFRLTHEPQ